MMWWNRMPWSYFSLILLSPSYTHTHIYTQTHTHKCKQTHPHTHKMTTENYFKFSKSLNWIHILFTDCVFTVIYKIFACRRGWENFFIKGQMVNDVGFVVYTISASANLIPSYSVKAVTKRKKKYINECVYVLVIVYWNVNFIIFMCYEIIFFFLKCLELI